MDCCLISFRRFSRTCTAALLCAVALLPTPAYASTASSGLVLVRETDVVREDFYATGNRVVIRGTVEGDLVAAAFESIVVEGTVQGDVIAIAGSVTISGEVQGSVRAIADSVTITGVVGDDVVTVVRKLIVNGEVSHDILVAVGDMTFIGEIGRDVRAMAWGVIEIFGTVDRNVRTSADLLVVSSSASVGGDVSYRGQGVVDATRVDGTTIELGDPPTPVRMQALIILGMLMAFLLVLSLGFLSFWVMPRTSQLAITKVGGLRWVKSLIVGALALVVPISTYTAVVAGAGMASPDLAAPASALFSPLLALYVVILATCLTVGVTPVSVAVGKLIAKRRSVFAHFVIGLIIVGAVLLAVAAWLPPPTTLLAVAGVLVIGLGAWVRGAWNARGPMQL